MIALVAQYDGEACVHCSNWRDVDGVVVKDAHVYRQLIVCGVVSYNQYGALTYLKGGQKIEMGGLEDLSKVPASSPFVRCGVEPWGRER